MSATIEIETLTSEQKQLVERLAASGGRATLTLNGEPLYDVTPSHEDDFEPLTEEEEAELIAIIDQADRDRANGRLTPYQEFRRELGLGE